MNGGEGETQQQANIAACAKKTQPLMMMTTARTKRVRILFVPLLLHGIPHTIIENIC